MAVMVFFVLLAFRFGKMSQGGGPLLRADLVGMFDFQAKALRHLLNLGAKFLGSLDLNAAAVGGNKCNDGFKLNVRTLLVGRNVQGAVAALYRDRGRAHGPACRKIAGMLKAFPVGVAKAAPTEVIGGGINPAPGLGKVLDARKAFRQRFRYSLPSSFFPSHAMIAIGSSVDQVTANICRQ